MMLELYFGQAKNPKGTKIMMNIQSSSVLWKKKKIINIFPLSQTVLETFLFLFCFGVLHWFPGAKTHQQIDCLVG